MQEEFACPVCGSQAWERLEEKHFFKRDIPKLNAYLQRRYKILFEAWFSGCDDARITSVICEACGFVAFTPRPTAEEVDRKYAIDVALGKSSRSRDPDDEIDRKRARKLFKDLHPFVRSGEEVLDYGGNDGRLVLPFLEAGHRCYVVDYAREPVEGVVRLASTIGQVDRGRSFGLIVLSHVLEHVAAPEELLDSLNAHQPEGGILFVEVPMELWGRVPPGNEPLTHLNYFTPPVLDRLLRRCGYLPVRCDLEWHYTRNSSLVVRAIARRSSGAAIEPAPASSSSSYAREMIRSSPRALLRILSIDWKRVPYILAYGALRGIYRRLKRVRKKTR